MPRNDAYKFSRPITPEDIATTYNNFYEFGSHKRIASAAQALPIRPWEIAIEGDVEKPFKIGIDELLAKMPLEERVYRLRCVEAWSMVIPWSGFPMRALLDLAKPLGKAKYVTMQTFMNPDVARGQRALVSVALCRRADDQGSVQRTRLHGDGHVRQADAEAERRATSPRRAVEIRVQVRQVAGALFEFTEERPVSFWEEIQAVEYGFWANVNPEVPHPRWSQATERGRRDRRAHPHAAL